MSQAKEIIYDTEARKKLGTGIHKLADAVRSTLGPKGKNVGVEKSWGAPIITNDGNSIVKEITLKDQYEQMGVEMAKEVALKLKDKCGDGTTTGTLLLDAMVQEGIKYIAAGSSPISIKRGMEKAVDAIVAELQKRSIPIKTEDEIKNIATVSASGHEEIGNTIAQAIQKVGKEGVVTIEESKTTDTTIEIVEGMQLDRGYISAYFCNNQEKMTVEMENPFIFITDKKISSIQEILPILQAIATSGRELLMIAEDIEADALATLVINKLKGILKVSAIKAPGFGDRRKALLEDIAILTGGTVLSEETGLNIKDAKTEMLGSAHRVIITKDNTTIVGGSGKSKAIESRIQQIEVELEKTTSSYDKENLVQRKAKLKGGVAVIHVGAATEPELKQRKQMFEDSLNSTKAALEEGVVIGGGMALFRAAQASSSLKLEGDESLGLKLVIKACETPAKEIAYNAGDDGSVVISKLRDMKEEFGFNARNDQIENLLKSGVIDPVKVVKLALLFALSVAGIILLSEALIGDAPEEEKT